MNWFGPAATSPDNTSHLIHRQRHIKRPFGENPTIISLAFRKQSSDSTIHAIPGKNGRAFLLHLMFLVGIELQSLHASFHWQLMKNNGQLLYLNFPHGTAFPTDSIWMKFQKWAPKGKQKANTLRNSQHWINDYFTWQKSWNVLHLRVTIDLKGVGASACQKPTLKRDFFATGGYFFLDKMLKKVQLQKNGVFLLASFHSCISVRSPS